MAGCVFHPAVCCIGVRGVGVLGVFGVRGVGGVGGAGVWRCCMDGVAWMVCVHGARIIPILCDDVWFCVW